MTHYFSMIVLLAKWDSFVYFDPVTLVMIQYSSMIPIVGMFDSLYCIDTVYFSNRYHLMILLTPVSLVMDDEFLTLRFTTSL